jgi:hypothetical protein
MIAGNCPVLLWQSIHSCELAASASGDIVKNTRAIIAIKITTAAGILYLKTCFLSILNLFEVSDRIAKIIPSAIS